jgi:hypothetical protein
MSGSDDLGFALPPFNPDEAHEKLRRDLRALGLMEREGRFERSGQTLARAAVTEGQLQVAMVKRPAKSSPEWQARTLTSSAGVRDFVAELKKRMAGWSDRDD